MREKRQTPEIKLILSGYYGYGNAGDEAILQSIIQSLKKSFQNSKITVFSSNPTETERMHNVKSVHLGAHHSIGFKKSKGNKKIIKTYLNIIKTIKRADYVLVGGGGIIHDWFGSFQIIKNLEKGILGKMMGKKTMLYAVGVGPINGRFSRFITRFALSFFDIITVRDQQSMELLKSIGVKKEVLVTGDPAISLIGTYKPVNESMAQIKESTGNKVIVCLRSWYHFKDDEKELEASRKRFNDKVLGLCNHITSSRNHLILLAFQPSEDRGFYRELTKNISGKFTLIDNVVRPDLLKGIISSGDIVIGMRLHSLIFAVSESVPVVAISYDKKIDNFIKGISKDIMIQDINELNIKLVISEIDSILAGNKVIDYTASIDIMKQKADLNIIALKKLVDAS